MTDEKRQRIAELSARIDAAAEHIAKWKRERRGLRQSLTMTAKFHENPELGRSLARHARAVYRLPAMTPEQRGRYGYLRYDKRMPRSDALQDALRR